MKEILWLLVFIGSFVAIFSAHTRSEKLRWLLVLTVAGVVGGFYVGRHGPHVALNGLLFVQRHTGFVILLFAVSVFGLIWAWRANLKELRRLFMLLMVLIVVGLYLATHSSGVPEDFANPEEQFKYGSIGSDHPLARGIPYWLWKVMPAMFSPHTILSAGFKPISEKSGYEAFGLVKEEGMDRPIGFSKRTWFGIDFIGMNCAFCHVSTLRKSENTDPEIILGMPANTVEIQKYFLYLFAIGDQNNFTPDQVMKEIVKHKPHMNFFERLTYRHALIPLTSAYIRKLKKDFAFIDPNNPGHVPEFGPGRVDPWGPGKATLFTSPLPVPFPGGNVDYTAIWNQKARAGMRLHWDGNTDVLEERNIIAALVVTGPCLECLDYPRVKRVTDWITWLPAPRYEDRVGGLNGYGQFAIKWDLVAEGKVLFRNYCAACHAPDGDRVGRVESLAELKTDRARLDSFTPKLAEALNTLKTDSWQLSNFKVQNGYVNMLLDGIWLRAPYLHNGSVPSLRHLLNNPCVQPNDSKKPDDSKNCRPREFYRGNNIYDWENVGFNSDMPAENGHTYFKYDTRHPGNQNTGHYYGTDLGDEKKNALIEYLKTL